jgi:membrane-associated phospholipid phosphatase
MSRSALRTLAELEIMTTLPLFGLLPDARGTRVAAILAACAASCLAFIGRATAAEASVPKAAPAEAPSPAPARPLPASHATPLGPALPPTLAAEPYRFQSGITCPICRLTPEFPQGRSGLHWHSHWASVGVREYATIGGLVAGIAAVRMFVPEAAEPRWSSPILFDDPVRDLLRIESASKRKTASQVSDWLFMWEVLHPTVLDPLVFAWWQRESPYVAWQMMVIDAQAYSMTLLVNDLVKRLAARQRPWVDTGDCKLNPDGEDCGSGGPNLSFYSGHAAVTATGAGLICAHHTQLSLYQNDLLDGATCALAVLGTAVTGTLRIASDNHWATDVITGHLLGYASGYLLPTLLYYKEFRATPHDDEPAGPVYATLPMVTRDALGVTVIGIF